MLMEAGNTGLPQICPPLQREGLEGETFGCHDRKTTALSTDTEQMYMPDDVVRRLKAAVLDRTNRRRGSGGRGECSSGYHLVHLGLSYTCLALRQNTDFF